MSEQYGPVGLPDFTYPTAFARQTVGVITEEVWSAERGYSKYVSGICLADVVSYCRVPLYAPPSGKVGYIRMVSFSSDWPGVSATFDIFLENTATGSLTRILRVASSQGFVIWFDPPLIVAPPYRLIVQMMNYDTAPRCLWTTAQLWEK